MPFFCSLPSICPAGIAEAILSANSDTGNVAKVLCEASIAVIDFAKQELTRVVRPGDAYPN